MKRKLILVFVFSILAATYVALSLMLTENKSAVFWIGFFFFIFALMMTAALCVMSTNTRSGAFPIEISLLTFSGLYTAIVFLVNMIFGYIIPLDQLVFLSIQIVCVAIFAIILLLTSLAKSHVMKQSTTTNGKIYEQQVLIGDFEKIKNQLINLPVASQKSAMAMIDRLLDELQYSVFSAQVDVTELDSQIQKKAISLHTEIDNLIEIQSDNLTALESRVNEIHQLIRDRNTQIKLLRNEI